MANLARLTGHRYFQPAAVIGLFVTGLLLEWFPWTSFFGLNVAFAAVAMGVLNTYARYFVPALAPAFFNVIAVAGGATLLLVGAEPETAQEAWPPSAS